MNSVSKYLLDHVKDQQEAYKKLKCFINDDTYFAYIQGLQEAVDLAQAMEEGIANTTQSQRGANDHYC